MSKRFGENLADALNSNMSDTTFKACMKLMQEDIGRAFLFGKGSDANLRYKHYFQSDPRIDTAANNGRTVPILFGFSKNHEVGFALVHIYDVKGSRGDANTILIYCSFLPQQNSGGESIHFKLRLGCLDGRLKPVVVVSHGIVMYVALAHPAFESYVIDIEEAAEIYAPTVY